MKFKILKGTETYRRLMEMHAEMGRVEKAAYELRKELGGITHYRSDRYFAGGISGVVFKEKPIGWKCTGRMDEGDMYMPYAKNAALNKRFSELPTMDYSTIASITGFPHGRIGTDRHGRCLIFGAPGIHWRADQVLMHFSDNWDFSPPNDDFVEIMESEYRRLAESETE